MEPRKLNQTHPMNRAGAVAQTGALIFGCPCIGLLLAAALAHRFRSLRRCAVGQIRGSAVCASSPDLRSSRHGFLLHLQKAEAAAPPGTAETCCAVPGMKENKKGITIKKLNKIMLWVITVFVLAFAFLPNYVGFFLRGSEAALTQTEANRI
jgi:hypothetical protein